MSTDRRLPDEVVDAALRGDTERLRALGYPDLAAVADTAGVLRSVARGEPARPSAALAALLEHGAVPATAGRASGLTRTSRTRRSRVFLQWIGGLSLAAKMSVASAVAAASVGVAGGTGSLPAPVQHEFDTVVATVTPFGDDDGADVDTGIAVEDAPTDEATTPAASPTSEPSDDPTDEPSDDASDDPTDEASDEPSDEASAEDSDGPTAEASEDDDSGQGRGRGRGRGGDSDDRDDDDDDDRSGSGRADDDDEDDDSGKGRGRGGDDDHEDDEHEDDEHEDEDHEDEDHEDEDHEDEDEPEDEREDD